jgi:hypothetical protein
MEPEKEQEWQDDRNEDESEDEMHIVAQWSFLKQALRGKSLVLHSVGSVQSNLA